MSLQGNKLSHPGPSIQPMQPCGTPQAVLKAWLNVPTRVCSLSIGIQNSVVSTGWLHLVSPKATRRTRSRFVTRSKFIVAFVHRCKFSRDLEDPTKGHAASETAAIENLASARMWYSVLILFIGYFTRVRQVPQVRKNLPPIKPAKAINQALSISTAPGKPLIGQHFAFKSRKGYELG